MVKMRGVLMTIVIVWGSLAQIWPKMFALEADRATTGRTVVGIVFHPAVTWIAGAVLVVWLIWALTGITKRLDRLRIVSASIDTRDEELRLLKQIERRLGPDQEEWVDRHGVSELVTLREVGVVLIQNRNVESTFHFKQWEGNFDWWKAKTLDAMKRAGASHSEISRFKILGTYSGTAIPAWNEAHAVLRDMLITTIRHLEIVIQRLEQSTS
jgi:hypothetical protein